MADDIQDADGEEILNYPQAHETALAWFRAKQRRAASGEEDETEPRIKRRFTVRDALDAYFQDGEKRGKKGLCKTKSKAKARIIPYLGHIEVTKLTRTKIEAWFHETANSPRLIKTKIGEPTRYAPPPATDDEKRARKVTANYELAILKAALNFVVDRSLIDLPERPWQLVKQFRGAIKARIRFLTVEEQVKLLKVCPKEFKELILGALLTGCRYGELIRLKCKDYDPGNGTIFIADSKSGKPRHIYLTEEGKKLFYELTDNEDPERYVFTHTRQTKSNGIVTDGWQRIDQMRLLHEACKKAGIEKVTFHELRHTYASTLVNRGCSLYVVAHQLGHSGTNMVERHYGHLAPSTVRDEVMRAMPKLGIA
jgi:integrase